MELGKQRRRDTDLIVSFLWHQQKDHLSVFRRRWFSFSSSIMKTEMLLMGEELGRFSVRPWLPSAFSSDAEPSRSIHVSHNGACRSRTSSSTCQGFSSRLSQLLFNLLRFPHLPGQHWARITDPQIQDFFYASSQVTTATATILHPPPPPSSSSQRKQQQAINNASIKGPSFWRGFG